MRSDLSDNQLPFMRLEDEYPDKMSLNDVIKKVKPTILLGLSGTGGVSVHPILSNNSIFDCFRYLKKRISEKCQNMCITITISSSYPFP